MECRVEYVSCGVNPTPLGLDWCVQDGTVCYAAHTTIVLYHPQSAAVIGASKKVHNKRINCVRWVRPRRRTEGKVSEGRKEGKVSEGRKEGKVSEGRKEGKVSEGRKEGKVSEGRKEGKVSEGRSFSEGRKESSDSEGRTEGSDSEGRKAGNDSEGRKVKSLVSAGADGKVVVWKVDEEKKVEGLSVLEPLAVLG
ncbi:hypothetical protein Pmani_038010 [Petrolisthes manimaculis]|uniref:Uncharacterized protein n=1 Tax=Petrolisthes manimaculis TaxID=1843537 RepID=A0AAE1NH81_9EUCA|nr:hypothetical protein Pmani_038010 [Petrolisthes manimaculis]